MLENASAYHENHDLSYAIATYEERLKHNPRDTTALNNLGVALCQTQQYEKGVSVFIKAIECEPDDAETHYNLGNAYLMLGDSQSAFDALRHAARLAPHDDETLDLFAKATALLDNPAREANGMMIFPTVPPETVAPEAFRYSDGHHVSHFVDFVPKINKPPPLKHSRPKVAISAEWVKIFDNIRVLEDLYQYHGFENQLALLSDKRRHLEDSSVLVFIIGEGNYGKSSLINAVLGRDVAEVDRKPKTWCIHLYRSQTNQQEEFAEIRRYGVTDIEYVSIADAKRLCEEQEKEVSMRVETDSLNATAFPGQIIEVNWYYHGFKTDPNVVLVDTPGFAQVRTGLNSARAGVIASHQGVVFDIGETYEHYYSHADLVLWAFRANKLNDKDTTDAITNLSRHTKPITGILTNFDRVPPKDRDETIRTAKQLYGGFATDFVSVVAGGKSQEKGLGISDLRVRISEVSRTASSIKLQSGHDCCYDSARFSRQWLKSIGDALIRNVSEVALYCNSTSDKLLRATYSCQQATLDEFAKRVTLGSSSAAFRAFLLDVIESETSKQEKYEEIAKYLQVDKLRVQMKTQLDQVSKTLVVEGQKEARTHKLEQVIVKGTGQTEHRQLDANIKPPDVSDLSLSLNGVTLPEMTSGLMDSLVEFFGGSFLGLVATFFGGRSREDRRSEAALKADHQIQMAVKSQITDAAKAYTKAGAGAILSTAESGLSHIYGGKGFSELQKDAARIDNDIKQMSAVLEQPNSENTLYQSLFRLWSPVDDARQSAIDMFLIWFLEHQSQLHTTTEVWLAQAIEANPLPKEYIALCCREYLKQTEQTLKLQTRISLREIKSRNNKQISLASIYDGTESWLSRLYAVLGQQRLFDEYENFLLDSFKHFHFDGLAKSFTDNLCDGFQEKIKKQFELGYMVDTTKIKFTEAFGLKKRLSRGSFILPVIGVGVVAGGGDEIIFDTHFSPPLSLSYFHIPSFHIPSIILLIGMLMGIAMAASFVGGLLLLWVQHTLWLDRKRKSIFSQFVQSVNNAIVYAFQAQWDEEVSRLTPMLARQIIGERTLVKKRPLEYALEGALNAYDNEGK